MKFYGSRFCQRCGRLFELAAVDQLRCAPCEESGEPAPRARVTPPATVKAPVRAPAKPRPRQGKPQPKVTPPARTKRAVTVNGTNIPGQRTLPMLCALAEAPKGLTTPDLAELIAPSASSWINALGSVRVLMLKQEKRGRVQRAGTVTGNRTRDSILWQITEAGRLYIQEADGQRKPPRAEPTTNDDPSRAARLVKKRNSRMRRIADARAGKRKINHLTEGAYKDDGCRCEECKFAHSFALVLQRAKRKLAQGVPLHALSAAERDRVENELAYREGRLWYRATPDGHVIEATIPRWVADGWFTPRRTVLEQLEAAMKMEP